MTDTADYGFLSVKMDYPNGSHFLRPLMWFKSPKDAVFAGDVANNYGVGVMLFSANLELGLQTFWGYLLFVQFITATFRIGQFTRALNYVRILEGYFDIQYPGNIIDDLKAVYPSLRNDLPDDFV